MKQDTQQKIHIDRIQEKLQTTWLGRNMLFTSVVGSTNDWAKALAKLGAIEGTVVSAEVQTAGHGRLCRKWVSPKGGLYFSVILKPKLEPSEAIKLVFVAGLAVVGALQQLYSLKAETKWPNDVLINGQKICGILSEMSTVGREVKYVVLGVGINADFDVRKALPKELRVSATSLQNELGIKVDLNDLFRVVLEKLECAYKLFLEKGFATVLNEWKKYARFLRRQVEVTSGAEKLFGLALDVDEEGSLILKLENNVTRRIFVGDVTLREK